MKTKINIILTTILLMAGLMTAACEGPEGPTGPLGTQGPQGEQGPGGLVGPAGADGTQMHAGNGAPDNELGMAGDFYLDLSTGDLYGPKEEDEGWGSPMNLQGEQGPQGPAGEDGQDGADGKDGSDGKDGADGAPGSQGPQGEQGPQGPAGADGQDGSDGADGSQIYAGDTTPDDSFGTTGDYYLNISTFDLYGPKTEAGWGTPINLQGPTGPQGPEGPQGEEGPEGPQGPPGEDGADGNANVTLYVLPGFDFSNAESTLRTIELNNRDEMFQSAWLVYLLLHVQGNNGGFHHKIHIPGRDVFQSTTYAVSQFFGIDGQIPFAIFQIQRTNGPGGIYSNIHVIRIEANNVVGKQIDAQALIPPDLDVSDYNAVKAYYGLD